MMACVCGNPGGNSVCGNPGDDGPRAEIFFYFMTFCLHIYIYDEGLFSYLFFCLCILYQGSVNSSASLFSFLLLRFLIFYPLSLSDTFLVMVIDKKLGWWWWWWKSSNLAVTRLRKVCKVYLRQVHWQPVSSCSTSLLAALCRDVNILFSPTRGNQLGWEGRRPPHTGRLLERRQLKFWKTLIS